jgi:amino acid adenylation domain-containing protein
MAPSGLAPAPTAQSPDLRELLRLRTAELGDTPAYVFLGNDLEAASVLSYAELGRSADRIARQLRGLIEPGDRVLLAFSNDLEAVQLFWGCILAHAIAIPAPAPESKNVRVSEARLQGIATDADVALALTHESHLETARQQIPGTPWHSLQSLLALPEGISPTESGAHLEPQADIAYLQYTSGSTSAPRGVEITCANVLAQCRALMSGPKTQGARGLVWLPWFHDYGLVHGLIQPLYSAGTSFLMSTAQFLLRPLRWLEAIEKHGVTHSGAPDFAYAACVKALARAPGWTTRLHGWHLATCGAEPVRESTVEAFASAFAPFGFNQSALAPSYGLAEAVLAVTVRNTHTPLQTVTVEAHALEQHLILLAPPGAAGTKTLVGCGPALPGFVLRIVDPETAELCAPDRVGEIWVAGPSVARGYWGQAGASAEVFGASLAREPSDNTHYLRTGDLGFMREGELFIAGRRKDLILVHGRNLYPQDLEQTAAAAHPSIRAGGVIAISIDKGPKESAAILVECGRRTPPEVVREMIDAVQQQVGFAHQLDLYDVVPLAAGSLPRTSSGKPQRAAARRLYLQGTLEPLRLAAQSASLPTVQQAQNPEEPLIETLIPLWSDVLERDVIDPDANFFDLGGDSLLATQLVSRLRTRLGVELPISDLFESPTVRGLARRVAHAQLTLSHSPHQMGATADPAPLRVPGDRVELSFSQERMWFMHEMAPTASAYNIPLAIRLEGALDMAALAAAWRGIVERHEILRTRFVITPEGPRGEVVTCMEWPIEEVQVQAASSDEVDAALRQQLAAVATVPFRLDHGPLARLVVFHLGPQRSVMLLVMHHIIGDQWSCVVLARELAALYSAAVSGTVAQLQPLAIQYADYAAAHRSRFFEARRDAELAYWSKRLEGLEPVSINGDFPRPRQPSYQGASLHLPFSKEAFAALAALGAAHRASLSMVLLTAVKVLLLRHTGRTDIAIGVPIANRNHLASEPLIGTFVNTLVFRTDFQGSPTFTEALSRVRDTALEAYTHQDMPFELLVRELKVRSDPSRSALFSVAFNHINSPARDIHFSGLEWSRMSFDRQAAQFDLAVSFDALYDPCIQLEYATDLFSRDTIERMGEHLLGILQAAVNSPDIKVSAIPILGEKERAVLDDWSKGPQMQADHEVIGTQLSAGLRMAPDRTALRVGDIRMSHRELDEASNRLARALRRAGVGRGSTVGLFMPRSGELIVALLAVLKSGAAYLPLDPAFPQERLAYQIADASMKVLLTATPSEPVARELFQGPVWVLDTERHRFDGESPAPLDPDAALDARGEDTAYLIYTSGSTGQPKGVAVPHRSVANLLVSLEQLPGMNQDVRLLAVTTLSFDIAVSELLLPLAFGATVVVATEEQTLDGRSMAALIDAHDINVLQATPSRWNVLLDSGWKGKPGLRATVTGEPLPRALAKQLCGMCGEVWNMYGPTETTVFSSGWRVDLDAPTGISLGRPIANTTFCILDPEGMRCPVGVMGEIWIGGAGLALGYHGRPDLTAAKFVDLPPGHDSGEARMYRTGDHGRWRWDGSLEHGGRMDDQIKLRGFRIELGDVEANLATCPGVHQAVAALRDLPQGGPTLVAYIVPTAAMPTLDIVRQHLRHVLPDYMIPTVLVRIDQVPVLANGKTNRKALPAPSKEPSTTKELALPRTHAEQLVWTVWSEVFETTALGVHDDFFDIGGHSLLAVGLARQLEQVVRKTIPVGMVFTHTTIAEMAAAIASDQEVPDLPVANLQPLGEGAPLFLLAGADMYRALAHQLAPDLQVYGLFSQKEIDVLELAPDQDMPPLSIESLAEDYLTLIRRIRPHGPYLLGGFSIGGMIAYEVANRLRAAGEEVSLLALLDCAPPGRGIRHLAERTWRRLRLLRERGWKYLTHVSTVFHHEIKHRNVPGQRRIKAYARAIRAYRPKPYAAPVLLVQSEHDPHAKPGYGWEALAPQIEFERIPGRHMTVLEPANAALLAQHLRRHLPAVRSNPKEQAR